MVAAPHPALAPVGHWTPGRKAKVVNAVRAGEVTLQAVLAAHGISLAEYHGWDDRHGQWGERGLAVTKLQKVR